MAATYCLPPLNLADGDELRPVAGIAEELTGQRPHPTTVVRWCAGRGAAGIKLPSLLANGRRVTTRAAYHAWLQAVNNARTSN